MMAPKHVHDIKVETTNLRFTSCIIFGAMHGMQPANIVHIPQRSAVCQSIKECLSAKTHHPTDMTLREREMVEH